MLTIKITTENAAFVDDMPGEVSRILHDLANAIEGGLGSRLHGGPLSDINGNTVGRWEWRD